MSNSKQDWFTAAQLAALALPDLPATARGISMKADRELWCEPVREGKWWRKRSGPGGGIEYNLVVLPKLAREAVLLSRSPKVEKPVRGEPCNADIAAMWAWFDRQTNAKKTAANKRLEVLHGVRERTDKGFSKVEAVQLVAASADVSVSAIYEWEKLTHRIPRSDWLPYLAPRHAGRGGARTECSPEAWKALLGDYLRPERRTFTSCYRLLVRVAAEQGWTIPSEKTLFRRLAAEITPQEIEYRRYGQSALKAMVPAQERDRSALQAMEALNADFHKWDVWVQWPGEALPIRPQMMALQDIYSGKILGWRLDKTPNKNAVRLCIGDVVETYGVPSHMVLDNGREFAAKWLTGQTPTRYRFKIRDEEPAGLLVQLGVTIHWANPYSGQSKPIERAFRDMATDLAKHPAFAGAYTGNTPLAKPENYREAAVPFDVFMAVISQGIIEHNTRAGREAKVCAGRSFEETFNVSYANSQIRMTSPDQRRLWLMAAEAITVDRKDGSIRLEGNRYHFDDLWAWRGKKVVVRFDPQNLHDDVHVYRLDGAYLGAAPCVEAVGFFDQAAAQEQARKVKHLKKTTTAQWAAREAIDMATYAQMLPRLQEPAAPPAPRVVQLITGNTVRQLAEPELHEQSEAEKAMVRAWAQQHGGPRLVHSGDE